MRSNYHQVQKGRKICGLGCVNHARTRARVTQRRPHIFLLICIFLGKHNTFNNDFLLFGASCQKESPMREEGRAVTLTRHRQDGGGVGRAGSDHLQRSRSSARSCALQPFVNFNLPTLLGWSGRTDASRIHSRYFGPELFSCWLNYLEIITPQAKEIIGFIHPKGVFLLLEGP